MYNEIGQSFESGGLGGTGNHSDPVILAPHPSPLPEGEGTIFLIDFPEGEGIFFDGLPEGRK